ncbi:hypothetical protein M422DRAFT_250014 [Sphaerobolus stellatus SS14]|nr:hypothetical protein M422DRAFT_250014 [Sphaerobolus stellatus SS14]
MSNATATAELQQLELEQLIALIRDSKIVVFATVVSLALLLYDYFLTLGQEIDLVWKRRFSWGKVLFFIIRYFGIFAHTFNTGVYINNTAGVSVSRTVSLHVSVDSSVPQFCDAATRFQTGSSSAVLLLVELTLAIVSASLVPVHGRLMNASI